MTILKSMIEKATYAPALYNLQVKEQVEMVCHMKIPHAFKSTGTWDGFSRMTNWDFELIFMKKTGFLERGWGPDMVQS
jgi:hypothetical protein